MSSTRSAPKRRGSDDPNPYLFGATWGYITDPSGLLQLGARFYWPEVGRFVSQDPVRDEVNWYAYVENEPLTGVDPAGTKVWTIWGLGHALQEHYGLGMDKLVHCVWQCMIVSGHPYGRGIGRTMAAAAGWVKEEVDKLGAGEFDKKDMAANKTGRGCGARLGPIGRKRSMRACETCCRAKLRRLGD